MKAFRWFRCPACNGEGGERDPWDVEWYLQRWLDCTACQGHGRIGPWHRLRWWFWDHVPVTFVEWWDKRRQP